LPLYANTVYISMYHCVQYQCLLFLTLYNYLIHVYDSPRSRLTGCLYLGCVYVLNLHKGFILWKCRASRGLKTTEYFNCA